uniref:Coluporin-27 n=1 Tax=Colubraria reticulata TaxID=604273 RepID=A0A499RTX0_9CAEN|nr:coluporin-27 [Colubraria reticulata]
MTLQFPRLKAVLVIVLFVIGREPITVRGQTDDAMLAIAADEAVTDGKSLAGNKAMLTELELQFAVSVVIEVENWTDYPLLYPQIRVVGGFKTENHPTAIQPAKREAFALHKEMDDATGVYGIVSWSVQGENRIFVIMWSAPFNFNFHSNWLGVGLTKKGHTTRPPRDQWFRQMYDGFSDSNFTFFRREFDMATDPVVYGNGKEFRITGVMTTNHKVQIRVTFLPIKDNYHHLAPAIRARFNLRGR